MFSSSLLLIVNLHQSKHVNTIYLDNIFIYYHPDCYPELDASYVYMERNFQLDQYQFFTAFFFPSYPFSTSLCLFLSLSSAIVCFSDGSSSWKPLFFGFLLFARAMQPHAVGCIHSGGQEGRPDMKLQACCSHPQPSNFRSQFVQSLSGNFFAR